MKSTMLGLLAIGLLAAPMGAQAVTWQVTTGGVLTGATDVNVGGTLYDVEFVDGTCVALFDGCDSVADFAFDTAAAATLASYALLEQVLLNVAGGNFDSNPWLTRGCVGSSNLCGVLTPYAVVSSSFSASMALNEIGTSNATPTSYGADRVSGSGGPISYDFTIQTGTTFARWTLAGLVSVAEPGTLALLGVGLLGLGVTRRKAAQATGSTQREAAGLRKVAARSGGSAVPAAFQSAVSRSVVNAY